MDDRPTARQGRRPSSFGLAVGAVIGLAALAEVRPASADGSPGSYAIVFDAAGELLAATYWIADDVRLTFRGRGQPAQLRPILLDREFMPRRLADFVVIGLERHEHSPDPAAADLALGVPVRVATRVFTPRLDAIMAGAARPEQAPLPEQSGDDRAMQLTLVSARMLTLGDRAWRTRTIELRDAAPASPGTDPVARLLVIDELGMVIRQGSAGPPAWLEQGRLISSADFEAHVEALAYARALPKVAECLTALRGTDAFKAAAATWRDVVDAYTARAFPVTGMSYVIDKGIKDIEPLMKQASVSENCQSR